MRKTIVFVLVCCMALLPLFGGSAQAADNNDLPVVPETAYGEMAYPAEEVLAESGLVSMGLSLFPLLLWSPFVIVLGIMVGNVIW